MPTLDREGVGIHYDIHGSGPAVLLTHGYAASSAMFAACLPELAASYTVITWDQRGHGRSDYPTEAGAYSAELAVADIAALLDVAGASCAVIGGHSLGGYLTLEFHLAHRQRVAGLVLIDTGPGFRRDEAREAWNRFAARQAAAFEHDGLAALGASEEIDAAEHRDATGLVLAGRHVLPQHDSRVIDSLPSIAVPTLVIVGADDAPFLDGSRYMATKIPEAELRVIEDAGHAPCVSQPTAFNVAVTEFLAGIGEGSW